MCFNSCSLYLVIRLCWIILEFNIMITFKYVGRAIADAILYIMILWAIISLGMLVLPKIKLMWHIARSLA